MPPHWLERWPQARLPQLWGGGELGIFSMWLKKEKNRKRPNSRQSYIFSGGISCSPSAWEQLGCRAGVCRPGKPVCCKHWWCVTWDFLWGGLDLVDLDLFGLGCFVHNQKALCDWVISIPGCLCPHSGASIILRTFCLQSRSSIISTTSWWMQWSLNWYLKNTRTGDTPLTPSFTRHSGTLQCLGFFWGRAVFLEHQAVLLLAEASLSSCADTPNPAHSAVPSPGQCWLSSPGWHSPLLSLPAS